MEQKEPLHPLDYRRPDGHGAPWAFWVALSVGALALVILYGLQSAPYPVQPNPPAPPTMLLSDEEIFGARLIMGLIVVGLVALIASRLWRVSR